MSAAFWIIEYGSTFTELFLCTIFCGTFVEKVDLKKNFYKRTIAAIVVAAIMLAINHIDIYSTITVVLGFTLMALMSFAVYSKNPLKAPVLGITFLLLIAVIDNIVVSIISYVLKIPTSEIYQEMSLYRVLAIISSKTILLFVVIAMNGFFSKRKTLQRKHLVALFAITTIMFIITVVITFIDIKNNAINSVVSILFFAVMLVLLMVIFFGTFKLTEHYENQEELKLTNLKNKMLEKSMIETEQTFMLWKTSMHDYKHNIANLMSLANNNDIEGIKQYLQNENELLSKKLFYYKTGNDTVDTILNIKQRIAESNGITFIINAEIPQECSVTSTHFASLFGNLLDNAIEASVKEEAPFIEVKIKTVKKYLMIVISNKCTISNTDLKTTKFEKHLHGIGLNSVKQTITKYNGTFVIDHTEGVFNAKIMIPM
ncbi:MAG: GHKL domain-containing protein [Oscillospiraceae bacterium]|nr:GHKL domain-containing protein [Oscillospiraceae bacterium]